MEYSHPRNQGADIAKVTFPHLRPEDGVGKYYESKAQDNKVVKFPAWDEPRTGPSMDLVYAKREYVQAEQKLEEKRLEYIERKAKLDEEWKDLANREEDLRKSFIMFHKFVKENQEKKERATRRIADEQIVHERRDAEIERIQMKIDKMTTVGASLEESVESLKIYEEYLNGVVEESPEFRGINQVLNRYDALSQARGDLVSRQKDDLEELERERFNMMQLIEDRTDILMGLNNDLADLQIRYEKAKNQSLYWESVVNRAKNKSCKELLKIFQVKDGIWNLYQQMCKRKNATPEIAKRNVEEQLLYIKRTISEYKRITKIAAKKCTKDISSIRTESHHSMNE